MELKKKFTLSGFPLLILLGLLGCSKQIDLMAAKEAMVKTDREFSHMSVEKGSVEAFYFYLAEDGKALPRIGEPGTKQDYARLVEKYQGQEKSSTLKWEPLAADISGCGDLGYTYGKYEFCTLDSSSNAQTTYGYYVTIWKKQSDGTWRFVFDAGNETTE